MNTSNAHRPLLPRPLAFALAGCALVASGSVMAQSVGNAAAQARTSENSKDAHQDARGAEQAARLAREAAERAEAERQAGAMTPRGQAQAEYSAWQAEQASLRAERAALEARRSATGAGAANSAAAGGTAMPDEVAIQSGQAAGHARVAGNVAQQAALEARTAAETARMAANTPPAPPVPQRQPPTETYPSEPLVTITSSPPDSVVGEYRIDMAAMDANGDGRISRAEARTNATLTAEFDAVDNNRDGVLDAEELKGWMR